MCRCVGFGDVGSLIDRKSIKAEIFYLTLIHSVNVKGFESRLSGRSAVQDGADEVDEGKTVNLESH